MKEFRFSTYWKNEKTSDVLVSADHKEVQYKRYTNEIIKSPFYGGDITVARVYDFLESRCMDKNRKQLPEYLKELKLEEYNPWEIVKITHGTMWEDFLWLKFEGESLEWEDVKLRD